MAERPTLERIVEEFVDDTAATIYRAARGIGDGYDAYGLRSLIHNVYTRIDDDQRCLQFSREMSAWARDYTRGISSAVPEEGKSGKMRYFYPAALIMMGSCTGIDACVFMTSGGSGYGGLIGLVLSGLLLGVGALMIRRLRSDETYTRATAALGVKPYERYADDIRDAPIAAVREALVANKEHAYATLGLAPKMPNL